MFLPTLTGILDQKIVAIRAKYEEKGCFLISKRGILLL